MKKNRTVKIIIILALLISALELTAGYASLNLALKLSSKTYYAGSDWAINSATKN